MTERSADIVIETRRTDQTVAAGRAVGRCCEPGDVIALQGELGAGKTQFVRGLAEGLGLNPRHVSSPTFVLMQEYEREETHAEQGDSGRCESLVHIDAYRIKSEDDLTSIGWYADGSELRNDAVVAIEWAVLIERSLGEDVLWVQIEHVPDGRRLSFAAAGTWSAKLESIGNALHEAGLNRVNDATA